MTKKFFLYPPYTPILTYSAIFDKYQYFISLTFSLGPDEVAIVWWLQKLVWYFNDFTLS